MKVRCNSNLLDGFQRHKTYEASTTPYVRTICVKNDYGIVTHCETKFFDFVEESKIEVPTITDSKNKIDDLKEHCKSEIQKEQNAIYEYETIIIARKQVIKTYETILGILEK